MSFVFYDTETTGTSTDFDQILQFAAIRTDAELNEIDRFETRCRLLPHIVPHPAALTVTGMSISRITDAAVPCHYTMVRALREKLLSWSPAIFVGYNSINFDEHLLRQALFKTLHAPYLTNTGGNGRADAMVLLQAASQFAPECLTIPRGSKGNAVFRLDHLAPANGFPHANAHDALADVEATIHLARCVKDRVPDCWERFVHFSAKARVTEFMQAEAAFVLTEFYFNRPYHFVVVPLGGDPDNPAAELCLDLRHDLDSISNLSKTSLARWVARSPKPVRKVKTNAAPSIAPIASVPTTFLGGLHPSQIVAAAHRVRRDETLRGRLIDAVANGRDEPEMSPHVEEQLYSGFISNRDQQRMNNFHIAPWQDRARIVGEFEDQRLRYHGYRLIYERHPEFLTEEVRIYYQTHDRDRLMDISQTKKWGTLPHALASIDAARVGCSPEASNLLDEYRSYLEIRIGAGG